jgi:hypothetical protein
MGGHRKVTHLDAASAAYIAGLVDGEGTITLTRIHRQENRRLVVSISNTERAILDFVRDALGVGRITTKRVYNERHRRGYTFQVSSRQALDLLEQVTPFLKSYKAARAALALAEYVASTPRNGKYGPEIERRRREFEARLLAIRP